MDATEARVAGCQKRSFLTQSAREVAQTILADGVTAASQLDALELDYGFATGSMHFGRCFIGAQAGFAGQRGNQQAQLALMPHGSGVRHVPFGTIVLYQYKEESTEAVSETQPK